MFNAARIAESNTRRRKRNRFGDVVALGGVATLWSMWHRSLFAGGLTHVASWLGVYYLNLLWGQSMGIGEIRHGIAVGVLALAATAVPTAANATTTNVPCNSIALINAIAGAGPGDTLTLAGGCTYILDDSTGPLPSINVPLTIHGHGSVIARDQTASAFRLFTVNSNFNLDRATLMGGDATTSPGGFGGAIAVNSGTTNLDRLTIQNNTGSFSGGLGGGGGTFVNVSFSRIQDNSVTANGGGAANDGTMTFTNSVIFNNSAGQKGGGVASDGTLRINNTIINDNNAGNVGGGVANINSGTATFNSSVVNSNTANNAPGGIDNEAGLGAVTLIRTNVRGNTPTNCSPTPVPGCIN